MSVARTAEEGNSGSFGPNEIVDGRINGTRITVWDVVYYRQNGQTNEEIAEILGLTSSQIQSALRYIAAHEDEVMRTHRALEERNARGNPPELQRKLDQSLARLRNRKAQT